MPKEEPVKARGVVIEALRAAMFRVKLCEDDRVILAHVRGKMRKHFIRVLVGDHVDVEMSPYDLARGRIMFRYK